MDASVLYYQVHLQSEKEIKINSVSELIDLRKMLQKRTHLKSRNYRYEFENTFTRVIGNFGTNRKYFAINTHSSFKHLRQRLLDVLLRYISANVKALSLYR